jgi:hypothetical protein
VVSYLDCLDADAGGAASIHPHPYLVALNLVFCLLLPCQSNLHCTLFQKIPFARRLDPCTGGRSCAILVCCAPRTGILNVPLQRKNTSSKLNDHLACFTSSSARLTLCKVRPVHGDIPVSDIAVHISVKCFNAVLWR